MDDPQQVHAILKLFPSTSTLADSPSYVYFGAILETFAKEKLIGRLWRHLAELAPSREEQLLIARRLREGLLKASPLVGFPRVSGYVLTIRGIPDRHAGNQWPRGVARRHTVHLSGGPSHAGSRQVITRTNTEGRAYDTG